jgi:hypothetical protein
VVVNLLSTSLLRTVFRHCEEGVALTKQSLTLFHEIIL